MWKKRNNLYVETTLLEFGVLNFTSTVFYGDMKNKKNRHKFLKKHFGKEKIIFGNQIHSDNIKIVTEKDIGRRFNSVDGFITDRKNVPVAVFTADCLPVFIFDKVKKIIGLIHAGRIGLMNLIVEKAIDFFVKNFSSNPKNIFVAIGPHIKKCCYGLDLDKIIIKQLLNKGIKKISPIDICTHDEKFFSYRRDKTKRRMISLMMMGGK